MDRSTRGLTMIEMFPLISDGVRTVDVGMYEYELRAKRNNRSDASTGRRLCYSIPHSLATQMLGFSNKELVSSSAYARSESKS